MNVMASLQREASVRKPVAKPVLPPGARPSRAELIARVDERANIICNWLMSEGEPDAACARRKAIIFIICLLERMEGRKLSGFASSPEYHPLYLRTRVADIEYNRLSKYFPALWWDVISQACRSNKDADISETLNSMELPYRNVVTDKINYILNVTAFLNNLV